MATKCMKCESKRLAFRQKQNDFIVFFGYCWLKCSIGSIVQLSTGPFNILTKTFFIYLEFNIKNHHLMEDYYFFPWLPYFTCGVCVIVENLQYIFSVTFTFCFPPPTVRESSRPIFGLIWQQSFFNNHYYSSRKKRASLLCVCVWNYFLQSSPFLYTRSVAKFAYFSKIIVQTSM